MTESIQQTIIAVAQADPETSAEQLAALRRVCAGKIRQPRARRMVRAPEARRILGGTKDIAPSTLRKFAEQGKINVYGVKGVPLYDADELYAFIGVEPPKEADNE